MFLSIKRQQTDIIHEQNKWFKQEGIDVGCNLIITLVHTQKCILVKECNTRYIAFERLKLARLYFIIMCMRWHTTLKEVNDTYIYNFDYIYFVNWRFKSDKLTRATFLGFSYNRKLLTEAIMMKWYNIPLINHIKMNYLISMNNHA